MNLETKKISIGQELNFCGHHSTTVVGHSAHLFWSHSDTENFSCHLAFGISPVLYQEYIGTNALFHLQAEYRTPLSNGDFQPDRPIQIEVRSPRP